MKLLGYMIVGGILSFFGGIFGLGIFTAWMIIFLAIRYAESEEQAERVADRLYELRHREQEERLWAKLLENQEPAEFLDDPVEITDYEHLN